MEHKYAAYCEQCGGPCAQVPEIDPGLERLLAEEEDIERQREIDRRDEDKRMRVEYIAHRDRMHSLLAQLQDEHDKAIRQAHEAYAAERVGFIEHFAYANGLMLAISSLENVL